MKTLLHVGCGHSSLVDLPAFFQDGTWEEIRYDINPDVSPDIVGTTQDMSLIEDGSIDAIYSSHNIEHIWAFEVPGVLAEFRRVLAPSGLAMILCPDILSVAQAITEGYLDKPVYMAPAGPITALDILYGYHEDIARGNLYMAHKTAFTAETLAAHLAKAGFGAVSIGRDHVLGLHALAHSRQLSEPDADRMAEALLPARQHLIELIHYRVAEA